MKKILIVDDEIFIALSLKNDLERSGFEVCAIASNAAKAASEAKKHEPDLILMDIHLANGESGIKTAENISEEISTEFIFMTGYDTRNMEIVNLPVVAIFEKPVGVEEIISAIQGT